MTPRPHMELFPHLHQIQSLVRDRNLFQYLFVGDNAVLLDTGASYTPAEVILPFLDKFGLEPSRLTMAIDTHADADHHGGNAALKASAGQMMLACGDADRGMIENPDRLFATRYNHWMPEHGVGLSLYPESTDWVRKMAGPAHRIDLTFRGGEQIAIDDKRSLRVLHVPGHNDGHLALYDPANKAVFVGEALHGNYCPTATGAPALPPGYFAELAYLGTLQFLEALDIDWIYSGHWPAYHAAAAQEFLAECRLFVDRASGALWKALERHADGLTLRTCMEECGPALGNWPTSNQWLLMYPLHGHLLHLEQQGAVTRIKGEPYSPAGKSRPRRQGTNTAMRRRVQLGIPKNWRRWPLASTFDFLRLLAFVSLVPSFVLAVVPPDPPYRAAVIRTGEFPGVRLSSGLTVYDEELRDGRLLTRYWGSNGQVVPDAYLESDRWMIDMLPADTFKLEIEKQELSGTWKWIGATKVDVHSPDGLLVTIELESTARPIRVKVNTLLSGGPVMVRWLEVTNTGHWPTAISNVSPWSGQLWHTPNFAEKLQPNATNVYEVGYAQYDKWGQEGAWRFDPVVNETKIISGNRGKSGWSHPSFFARNNSTGEWFAASLGWSGNWKIGLTSRLDKSPTDRSGRPDWPDTDARLFFEMGPSSVDPALRVLDPGETVKTAETHILCMKSDLDHVTQALLDHVRKDVLPAPPSEHVFDVEANHRGYMFDHETEAGFKREIDMAADIGAEMFVIDAGWYGPEPNRWYQNVGDWYPGAWLPNDLQPVREYARSKGMQFGLWMEPEGIGANSKLAKEHPDWILKRNGQPVTNNRQIDVANPVVAQWMESEIARIIRKYDLDMFRIDYNTTTEEGGNHVQSGFVENSTWRHVDNLYAMFDRLRKQFPKVIFQNCAGGGGRLDYGILRRFDSTELSDWMRAPRGLKILNGMTWLLPPEILLRTFGTEVPDLAGDGDVESQLATVQISLPIFRGISPSPADLNPLLRARIRSGMDLYKHELRPILRNSRVFHHTPQTEFFSETPWLVLEYATPDERRAVTTLFRTSNFGDSTFRFVPRGLDLSRTYKVTFKNRGEIVELSGLKMMQDGIPVRLETTGTSEMLLFSSDEPVNNREMK